MAYAFFLGVDVDGGETDAPEALTLALIEKEKNPNDDVAGYRLDRIRHYGDGVEPGPLADRIQSLVAGDPYIGRTSVIINRQHAAGQALADALSDRGLDPVRATLRKGGAAAGVAPEDTGVQLRVRTAVQTLVGLYEDGCFAVEEHSTEAASRLAREVQHAFEVLDEAEGDQASGTTPEHPPTFENVSTHLTSTALAAWLGTERSFDPSQHLKEDPQTGRP